MLKKILIGLVVLVAGFLGFVAMQPADYVVTRSAKIAAPASLLFPLANDFHNWPAWSPWEKIDPSMKRTLSGATAGVDAVYEWAGNDKAGAGKMTILQSKANEQIKMKLEFTKPFAATDGLTFDFAQTGAETSVTWKMDGHNDLMGKAAGIFISFDKMVGGDFEKGLAAMKELGEAAAKKAAEAKAPEAAAEPA